jgi:hypothetical protein
MKISGKVAALALAAMMAAGPAQACWTSAEQDAAKVANLNTMMMVSALRCRHGQDNFLSEYNQFVKVHNPVLGSQNAAVRQHFARTGGTRGADAALDRFVIAIANHYGAGHSSMGCGQLKLLAGELAARTHNSASLVVLAEANIESIPLPGGSCPITIAAK